MLLVVLAGVKWVVKLQLLLLAIILLSVLDFVIGTFAHTDEGMLDQGRGWAILKVAHASESRKK